MQRKNEFYIKKKLYRTEHVRNLVQFKNSKISVIIIQKGKKAQKKK